MTEEESKEFMNIPRTGEEKGVVELKHDIARIQKKTQEEIDRLITEVTAKVKTEFENLFLKKKKKKEETKAESEQENAYLKMIEQLNFWRKKRQAAEKDRDYAETQVAKEELDVELRFIDKRIEAYNKRCERYKKKRQADLDAIKAFREKDLKEFYSTIADFLTSRETQEEEEADLDAEEDEQELNELSKPNIKK